jgi:hypothetical protein
MSVEHTSGSLIPPDVAVDGLVADAQMPQTGKMSGDLLGAPLAAEQRVYLREILGRESLITA